MIIPLENRLKSLEKYLSDSDLIRESAGIRLLSHDVSFAKFAEEEAEADEDKALMTQEEAEWQSVIDFLDIPWDGLFSEEAQAFEGKLSGLHGEALGVGVNPDEAPESRRAELLDGLSKHASLYEGSYLVKTSAIDKSAALKEHMRAQILKNTFIELEKNAYVWDEFARSNFDEELIYNFIKNAGWYNDVTSGLGSAWDSAAGAAGKVWDGAADAAGWVADKAEAGWSGLKGAGRSLLRVMPFIGLLMSIRFYKEFSEGKRSSAKALMEEDVFEIAKIFKYSKAYQLNVLLYYSNLIFLILDILLVVGMVLTGIAAGLVIADGPLPIGDILAAVWAAATGTSLVYGFGGLLTLPVTIGMLSIVALEFGGKAAADKVYFNETEAAIRGIAEEEIEKLKEAGIEDAAPTEEEMSAVLGLEDNSAAPGLSAPVPSESFWDKHVVPATSGSSTTSFPNLPSQSPSSSEGAILSLDDFLAGTQT